ncbi:hypothetical protein H072_5611 [Dactylellina haptotyla CBS 200.50]|uniref:Pop1 N-terminal domain-containing protein n=1 Tax=Dactylellina haptotyla (strain CBS 200.50) TaxID=1284197 RepID=S8BM46_DACHA|nr:hypothetical protein H072_5611 [Dactylellina haptotyla CBS 200.50]
MDNSKAKLPAHSHKRKHSEPSNSNTFSHKPTQPPSKNLLQQHKRRKFQDAREISAQASEEAFRDGQFDMVSFVSSREYEIKSLLRSMNSSKNAQRKRAFQNLPRDLRRRTAAHSAKRVPKRVRATARLELVGDNTAPSRKRRDYRPETRRLNVAQLRMLSNTSTFAPRGGNSGSWGKISSQIASRSSRYRKRQRHKTWLPTHIWTAKRAHMVTKWGFVLADTPTLKCYRPTYRAATRGGCMAFDTSYYATVVIEGRESNLKRCLMKLLPPRDLGIVGKSVVSGESTVSTWLYEERGWPTAAIAPVQLFWCNRLRLGAQEGVTKGNDQRKVILRVHPASWDNVWRVVASCSTSSNCIARNLRFEIGSIRLTGPQSTNILEALVGVGKCKLARKSSPLNTIIYESAEDPRINSFYVRNSRPVPLCDNNPHSIGKPHMTLFDRDYRNKSVNGLVSQKTINSKVAKWMLGNRSEPLSRSEVPLVMIKESLGEHSTSGIPNSHQESSCDCWSILLPWKWVRPFWLVLVRTNGVRMGGLKEIEQLTLETGVGYYPVDFPVTTAGQAEAARRCREASDRTDRRKGRKTKQTLKQSLPIDSPPMEAEYGYPWSMVFGSMINPNRGLERIWTLPPNSVNIFAQTQNPSSPLTKLATFTAYITLIGRGKLKNNAYVYGFPEATSSSLKSLKIKHTSCTADKVRSLETLIGYREGERDIRVSTAAEMAGSTEYNTGSPIGFVIRGNFSFAEGQPVAIAVLAWSKAWGCRRQGESTLAGWCFIRNEEERAMRVAQWSAI